MAETLERPLCDCHGEPMHTNGRHPSGRQKWRCAVANKAKQIGRRKPADVARRDQRRYLERLHAGMTPAELRAWKDKRNASVERWLATPHGAAYHLDAGRRRRALELEAAGDYGVDRQPTALRKLEGDWHWQAILAEYGGRCAYCGSREQLTLDHYVPLAAGGLDDRRNIVPACKACNSAKRDRDPFLFDRARLLGWA